MASKLLIVTEGENMQEHRPNALFGVWIWEIRRVFANPLNWLFGLATFLFFMGIMWFKHAWSMGTESGMPFVLYGTSAIGVLYEFTVVLMFVFAFILPFVVTEGVARDYKKRMHEVLMTTPLPTAAYVWGRFLAVLSIALGQAVMMLLASVIMGFILHARSADFPIPVLREFINGWGLLVIPPTILITGIGFSLGTLWPGKTRLIMLGILITWILLFTVGDVVKIINPTNISLLGPVIHQFVQSANSTLAKLPDNQRGAWVQQLQAIAPDLQGWVLPQYSLAAGGILLVIVAAARFRRFRNELD